MVEHLETYPVENSDVILIITKEDVKMKEVYCGEFVDRNDMLMQFNIDESALSGYKVLLAFYSYECYEGYAFVLLKKKKSKELFTVYGSHCSCYGLEDQFDMESASIEQIEKLHASDYYYYRGCSKELGEILVRLKEKAQ